jgi:multidrug transporter EmrE-like cation transporter
MAGRTSRSYLAWYLLLVSVVFDATGIFAIKLTLNRLGQIPVGSLSALAAYFIDLLGQPVLILGGVLFILAPFVFAAALSRMEVTTAYPVQVGLNFGLLVTLAVIFLGERLTVFKSLGLALLVVSVLLLFGGQEPAQDQEGRGRW